MQYGVDNSWTFADLKLRLAEACDVATQGTGADNRSEVPSDPNTLDRLSRAINDAAKDFARNRHRWTWLCPTLSITLEPDADGSLSIAGDSRRYRLPVNVISAPVGRMTWRDPSSSYGGRVTDSHIDRVWEYISRAPSLKGQPLYASVWTSNDREITVGERPPMELVVYPAPDLAYTIRSRFRVDVPRLVNNDDRGIWGSIHDQTVLAIAVTKFMSVREDGYATAVALAEQAIAKSIEVDMEMHAKRLGSSEEGQMLGRSTRGNVLNYDGSTIISY
jgi:hypothetical protein